MMRIDIRCHAPVREVVKSGLIALRVQGRQIWGDHERHRHNLDEIVVRLMVGVGDLARVARNQGKGAMSVDPPGWQLELKKELGNILFSTVRWIDDLGLDPLECLDLAIEAQERFVSSGQPR